MKTIDQIIDWQDMIGEIMHADCLDVMRKMPDKCIDLILTDPPYGINIAQKGQIGKSRKRDKKNWDSAIPTEEIFNEIIRVSKHAIIWGGNYFTDFLPPSRGWIFWDKNNAHIKSFADGELAWTSFDSNLKKFKWTWHGLQEINGKKKEIRQHPTQKPLELGRWCLVNYTKKEEREKMIVFDPFGGSFTFARACQDLGIRWISCDMEKEYCEIGENRLKQQNLF